MASIFHEPFEINHKPVHPSMSTRLKILTSRSVVCVVRSIILTSRSVVWVTRPKILTSRSVVWVTRSKILTSRSDVWVTRSKIYASRSEYLKNPFSRSIASVQTGELPVCYPFGSRAFHPFKGKPLVYVFPREVTSVFGSILVTEFSAGKQYFPITT